MEGTSPFSRLNHLRFGWDRNIIRYKPLEGRPDGIYEDKYNDTNASETVVARRNHCLFNFVVDVSSCIWQWCHRNDVVQYYSFASRKKRSVEVKLAGHLITGSCIFLDWLIKSFFPRLLFSCHAKGWQVSNQIHTLDEPNNLFAMEAARAWDAHFVCINVFILYAPSSGSGNRGQSRKTQSSWKYQSCDKSLFAQENFEASPRFKTLSHIFYRRCRLRVWVREPSRAL